MDNRMFKEPREITDAIHQTIKKYPGGYGAMAKRLDPKNGTYNSLYNRLRPQADDFEKTQIIPLGMALDIEVEAESTEITEAIAKYRGGVFVKLPEFEDLDNDELLKKFNELMSGLGDFCRQHNQFTSDGVLDSKEKKALKLTSYNIQCRLSEILVITDLIFGKGDR